MDGISRSRGWDKEIPHCVLHMEQLVLGDKWARIFYPSPECFLMIRIQNVGVKAVLMCLISNLVWLYIVSLSALSTPAPLWVYM